MAFIADPSLNEVYNFGSNAAVTLLNGRPVQLNKASVDTTDAFYVNVTGGTGRAAVLSGGSVMVGPTSAVANGNLDVAVDGASAMIVSTAYGTGNAPAFRGRAARGTMASPTASQSGDLLASFSARGYGATAFATNATGRYGIYASENWTDSAQGTNIQFETSSNGTTTRVVRSIITHDGRIVIGSSESASVPALKASGTGLQVKLGDDSSFAPLTSSTLNAGGVTLASGAVTGASFLNVIASTGALDVNTQAAQPVTISTNGTLRWTVSSTGHLTGNTDNALDIGATGTGGRIRNLYAGTKVWVGNSAGTVSFIDTSGNFYTTGQNEHVGTTSAHSLFLDTNGTARWELQSTGHMQAGADNTYDIGGTSSNNARSIYVGTSVVVAGNVTVSTGNVSSTGNAGAFFLGSTTNSVNVNLKAAGTTSSLLVGGTDNVYLATGTSAGTTRWQVNSSGHFLAGTDNTYDIGATGATRPRTGYYGTSLVSPLFTNDAALSITTTAANGDITLDPNGTGVIALAANVTSTGKITNYSGVATTAWGVPAIYATGRADAQTAAVATVATYTVGGSDGTFEVAANVLVTASTTHNFTVTVDYTDESNTARSAVIPIWDVDTAAFTTNGTITDAASGTGVYYGIPLKLRCKASTAITVKTTGTFTSVTYNVEGSIVQVA